MTGADTGIGTPAWININGKDIKLALTRRSPSKINWKIGTRFVKYFSGGGFDVEIKFVVLRTSEETSEDSGWFEEVNAEMFVSNTKSRGYARLAGWYGCM